MTNIGISHVLYRKKQKILMLRKFCYEVICFPGLFVLLPKLRIMSLLLEWFKTHTICQIQKIALKVGFFCFPTATWLSPNFCGNQQRCLHFRLLLEDPFEQLSGIVKNVDRHGKPALFLIMTDSCLKIIQAKIKVVRRRKSVNNATIFYSLILKC